MSFFGELISYFGGGVALTVAAAYLAKMFTEHKLVKDLADYRKGLDEDLEEYKISLNREAAFQLESAKFEFERELVLKRGEVDIFRDEMRHLYEKESERQERVRAQILRWANPILAAITDLRGRLENILRAAGYLALAKEQTGLPEQWSIDYTYFMSSTIFYFAQYFCWTQLFREKMSFELFQSQKEKDQFLAAIDRVGETISRFPFSKDGGEAKVKDQQVFRLQQRAMGEALVIRSEPKERLMAYQEFMDRWQDSDEVRFRRHFEPLETFLRHLRKTDDLRWTRLEAMFKELGEYEQLCRTVLQPEDSDA